MDNRDELLHYGVLGMKWGVRKDRSGGGYFERRRAKKRAKYEAEKADFKALVSKKPKSKKETTKKGEEFALKTLDSYWTAAEKEDKARASLSNRKVTYMSSLKDSADALEGKGFVTQLLKAYYSTTVSSLSSEARVDQMRYDYTKQNLEAIRKARGR